MTPHARSDPRGFRLFLGVPLRLHRISPSKWPSTPPEVPHLTQSLADILMSQKNVQASSETKKEYLGDNHYDLSTLWEFLLNLARLFRWLTPNVAV